MSWLKLAQNLVTLKKFHDAGKEAKSVYDYAKKIDKADPKKLKWDDLKFFNNKQMVKATQNARDALAAARQVEAAKLTIPQFDSVSAFVAAAKAADRYGAGSPQVQAALKRYVQILKKKDADLTKQRDEVKKLTQQVGKLQTEAEAFRDYANVLHSAFMKCARVPSLTGTAQNSIFFSLAQDAVQFRGVMSGLVTSYGNIQKATMGQASCRAPVRAASSRDLPCSI